MTSHYCWVQIIDLLGELQTMQRLRLKGWETGKGREWLRTLAMKADLCFSHKGFSYRSQSESWGLHVRKRDSETERETSDERRKTRPLHFLFFQMWVWVLCLVGKKVQENTRNLELIFSFLFFYLFNSEFFFRFWFFFSI